jgi:molybdate transport system ATP-binding protein
VAERLVLLRDGAVEAEGRPIDLLAVPGVAREAEDGLEYLMSVRIAAHDADAGVTRIDVTGGPSITIPLAPERAIGSAATLAIRAEDILVSIEPVRGLSARNVVAARVTAVERAGADAILRCALAGPAALLAAHHARRGQTPGRDPTSGWRSRPLGPPGVSGRSVGPIDYRGQQA